MYEDLEHYQLLISDNVIITPNRVNQNDVYDAICSIEAKLVTHVINIGVDEKAIRMQEIRSQLIIILQDAMGVSSYTELLKLEYILSINICKAKFDTASHS